MRGKVGPHTAEKTEMPMIYQEQTVEQVKRYCDAPMDQRLYRKRNGELA